MIKIFFIMICLLCFACVFADDIYRSVDAHGVVTYSDQPSANAKTITLQSENIASQAPDTEMITPDEKNTKKTVAKHVAYKKFTITEPTDQETFQNATDISVKIELSPALQSGDKIQYYLDDQAVSGVSANTTFTIPKVSDNHEIITRGTHTVSAKIINASGEIIKTTPLITIFAHYPTIITPVKQP